MARNRRKRNRSTGRRRKRQGQPSANRTPPDGCLCRDDNDDDDDNDGNNDEGEESQMLLTPSSTTMTTASTVTTRFTETNAHADADDGDAGETSSSSSSKSSSSSSSSSELIPARQQPPRPPPPPPQQRRRRRQQQQKQTADPQQQQLRVSNFQKKLSFELNRSVFTLQEFIKHHAPDFVFLDNDRNGGNNDDNGTQSHSHSHSHSHGHNSSSSCKPSSCSWPSELETMLISPLATLPKLNHLRRPECHEPVSSLIDDVVWSLVQRQERGKRRRFLNNRQKQQKYQYSKREGLRLQNSTTTRKTSTTRSGPHDSNTTEEQHQQEEEDFRNVLIQGYTAASEGETTPYGMRPGVALISRTTTLTIPTNPISPSFSRQQRQQQVQRLSISTFPINENLAFCKSSSVIQFLHSMVGDVMMRMMLLHTRIFLPLLPSTLPCLRRATASQHHHRHHRHTSNSTIDRVIGSIDLQSHGQKYLLLCGPPLPPVATKFNRSSDSNMGVSRDAGVKRKNDDCVFLDANNNHDRPKKRKKRHRYQSTQEVKNTNGSISRFPLLYFDAYVPRIGLPKSHILQKIRQRQLDRKHKRNPTSSRSETPSFPGLPTEAKQQTDHDLLFNTMLGLWRLNKNKQRRIRKRIGPDCVKLCKTIVHGHFKCDYHRLLERYCPLPPAAKCRQLDPTTEISSSKNDRLMELAHAYTCKDGIVLFLRRVLQQVFPIESFWGSSGNFDAFMVSVENFVYLRRRERLANKCLMHGIRVTRMKWLMTNKDRSANIQTLRSSHDTLTNLSLNVLRWVFQGFIIPLLRSIFYVTETEFSGQELQYYRKPVWSLFRSVSIKKIVKESHFQSMSFSTTLARLRNHNQIGLSRLRLLPKTTGLRPINQLSLRQSLRFLFQSPHGQISNSRNPDLSQTEISSRLPANVILRKVLDVLRYESNQLESPFGVGMESLEMFYSKYRDYVTRMRVKFGSKINLFAASVDIEKCYDRMNQDVLFRQLNDLVSNCSYVIQQIRLNHFVGDSRRKCSNSVLEHGCRTSHSSRIVTPMDTYQPLQENQDVVGDSCDTIFEMSKCTMVEQAEVVELLKEHLTSQMVVVSGRFQRKVLLQRTGIAQGSVLSTILCNLYYGNVEKILFSERPTCSTDRTASEQSLGHGPTSENMDKDDDLMARFVDDYLFLSPKKESVGKFLARAHEGVPSLGAEVNQEKSMVSADIPVHVEAPSTSRLTASSAPIHIRHNRLQHPVFSWCGLLFDLKTGEVSMDYERFRGGRLRDSLTVESNGSEGLHLKSRMKSFAQPRCLPILFDAAINSPSTIAVNYYEMIAISAAKTVEYLRSHSKLLLGSQQNPSFIWTCIEGLGTFARQNIKGNLRRLRRKDLPKQGKIWGHCFHLRQEQSNWLTWKAFYDVFSSTDDFYNLAQMLSNKEPCYRQCSNDLALNHIAASSFEHLQLKHFIALRKNGFPRNTKY